MVINGYLRVHCGNLPAKADAIESQTHNSPDQCATSQSLFVGARLTFEELEPAAARDVGGRVVVDLFVAAGAARRGSRRRIGGACCLRLVGRSCPRGTAGVR